jgi:hypothetical protein
MAMSAPSHDAELEVHLRDVIREELAADRRSRTDMYWWIAVVVVFGPFALVGGAVVAVVLGATALLGLGTRLIRARRERGGASFDA